MDMSGMSSGGSDGNMGNTSMGNGIPSLFYLQQVFWTVMGAAIACAATVNIYNKILWRQRCVKDIPNSQAMYLMNHIDYQQPATVKRHLHDQRQSFPPPLRQ